MAFMGLDFDDIPDDAKISVYVANLGVYAEGGLQGGWVTLPMPPDKLDQFLRAAVGLETDHRRASEKSMRGERVYEEYAIHDYDMDGLLARTGIRPSEYTDINDLNLLASVVAARVQEEGDGVLDALEAGVRHGLVSDPIAVANLAMQSDEIPFFFYGIDESVHYSSLEEKFGYSIIESGSDSDLTSILDGPYASYFDVEKYGRDMAMDFDLYDNGYYDLSIRLPDTSMYTRDELADYAGLTSSQAGREFDLASLAKTGESTALYTLLTPDGVERSYQCIVPVGGEQESVDITSALKDTLHRITTVRLPFGDGDAVISQTMGVTRFNPNSPETEGSGSVSVIDDGWALPGVVTSVAFPPSTMLVEEEPVVDVSATVSTGRTR